MAEVLKTPKQMERHLKGLANHRRIEILFLIAQSKGITFDGIVEALDVHPSTLSEHTHRLLQAGLVEKKYRGRFVVHTLSPYGRIFVNFLRSFQKLHSVSQK